jgi:hypothetical protein
MKASFASAKVLAHAERVLHRSTDLALQSAILRRQSRDLILQSASLTGAMRKLRRQTEESIVHGFVVAREGRRIVRRLRRPYARAAEVELKIVDLAGFRRRELVA